MSAIRKNSLKTLGFQPADVTQFQYRFAVFYIEYRAERRFCVGSKYRKIFISAHPINYYYANVENVE